MKTYQIRLSYFATVLSALLVIGLTGCDDNTRREDSVVGLALSDSRFTTLVAALERADLVDTLSGTGPFTVFAPTNEAFAAAGVTDVSAIPVADLANILLYHVVSGEVDSMNIPTMASSALTNEYGDAVTLLFDTSMMGVVKVNDATVVEADVLATNGIIHAIDTVLLPPDIVNLAITAGLTELVAAVLAAGDLPGPVSVEDALRDQQPYTVLAPTDAAFAALPAVPTGDALRDVLLLHVINAGMPVTSAELPTMPVDTLLASEQLVFDGSVPSVSSAGTAGAMIGPADIHATNGVVHVIDKVLLPSP